MYEGYAVAIKIHFETISCFKCNMLFAVDAAVRQEWLDKGTTFYCPNGHQQHYCESNLQRAEKERDRLKVKLTSQIQRTEWERQEVVNANNRTRSQKAAKTRIKNRIGAGVCPIKSCHRSFQNLRKHMETKHPH